MKALQEFLSRCMTRITERREMNRLEKMVMEAFVQRLGPDLAARARRQLSEIRRCSDYCSGQATGFILNERPERSGVERFANRDLELTVAYVFGTTVNTRQVRASISVIDGLFDAISFAERPVKAQGTVSAEDFEVVLDTDLGSSGAASTARPADKLTYVATRTILAKFGATSYQPPQSPECVQAFQRYLGCTVPDGFLQLVGSTNGFRTERWEFYGVSGRTMVWPTRECIKFIAEDPESTFALCFLANDEAGDIFFLNQPDSDLERIGSDVERALSLLEERLSSVRDEKPI